MLFFLFGAILFVMLFFYVIVIFPLQVIEYYLDGKNDVIIFLCITGWIAFIVSSLITIGLSFN